MSQTGQSLSPVKASAAPIHPQAGVCLAPACVSRLPAGPAVKCQMPDSGCLCLPSGVFLGLVTACLLVLMCPCRSICALSSLEEIQAYNLPLGVFS